MHGVDCGCALLALRTLARVEELTTSSQVPLETALHVTFAVERPSLSVLSCERCRQQRLPLTAVTILCALLVDWLCRLWDLDDEDAAATITNTDNVTESRHTIQGVTETTPHAWKFSLGSYDVAADEATAVGNELMILRLTRLSGVLGSLEAALITSEPPLSTTSSSRGGTDGTTSDPVAFAPGYLDLVRADLRLVRACIRRLKAQSLLLNSGGASTLV